MLKINKVTPAMEKYRLKMAKSINKEDIRFCLQRAETQLDSLTQKLLRRQPKGKEDEFFKQARIALYEVRKLQFRYFPVTTHSLLRYNDCEVRPDGTFIRPIQKNNWRKYKKEKEREKLKKFETYIIKRRKNVET